MRDGAGDIPVYSAQRVVADAGVVGEDDGAAEPILGADGAPERGFARYARRIGGDPQLGHAERGEMGRPLGLGAEFEDLCGAQRVDDAVGQIGARI